MVNDKFYSIEFAEPERYSVFDSTGFSDNFISKDTVFVDLSKQNIKESSIVVKDAGGNIIDNSKYLVKADQGKIRGNNSGDLPIGEAFTVEYRFYPVYNSILVDSSDANPVFDGMRLFVKNTPLDLSYTRSGWDETVNTNIESSVLYSKLSSDYVGTPHIQYRADWEIQWLGIDTLADGSWKNVGDTATGYSSAGFCSTCCTI